jgi:hypothetical protein
MQGVEYGRIDAVRALAALDAGPGAAPATGALTLSREQLSFAVRPNRVPRAQVVTVHADGGTRATWSAAADAPWIALSKPGGETPQRLSIRIDPSRLQDATVGHVQFRDAAGRGPVLTVRVQHTNGPALDVAGDGCRFDGTMLHAAAGAGCTVRAVDGTAPGVAWVVPGGAQVSGGRLDAQFVRAGAFEILVGADEGEMDAVPVLVE